jgi:glucokinase-like ROK family protein
MTIEFKKHDTKSEQMSILNIINRYGRITRKDLVNLTGFSQAKISITINELKKSGILQAMEGNTSSGGRKANLLQLHGANRLIIGVELGGYEIKASLIDFSGKILAKNKIASPADMTDPRRVAEKLIEFIDSFKNENGVKKSTLKGIGIGLSGIVNQDTGCCDYFKNQKSWEGFALKELFEESYDLPCTMQDSARMMAVAEKRYGSARECSNFIVISLGVGVGAGIYINGNLFQSRHGFGGEVGHMVIKENGPRCVCGNYGCLETFVSGYALERQMREALNDNVYTSLMDMERVSTKKIIEQAKAGDKLCYSIIHDAAKHLGIGIANIINIFNPEIIILSGGVAQAKELLADPVEHVVKSTALSSDCPIVISELDEYSGSLGAASYWLAETLKSERAYEIIVS